MASAFDTDFAAAAGPIEEVLAETIVHYPGGDLAAPEPIEAIVDRGNEAAMLGGLGHSGSAGGQGEGADFDTETGVKLRRSVQLVIDDSVAVTESSSTPRLSPSLFEFDGYRWRTVRVMGRAGGKQQLLVTRLVKIASRRSKR